MENIMNKYFLILLISLTASSMSFAHYSETYDVDDVEYEGETPVAEGQEYYEEYAQSYGTSFEDMQLDRQYRKDIEERQLPAAIERQKKARGLLGQAKAAEDIEQLQDSARALRRRESNWQSGRTVKCQNQFGGITYTTPENCRGTQVPW